MMLEAAGFQLLTDGIFITFEGGEGAGKSTQIKRLAKHFEALDLPLIVTREPGGSVGAEAVRHVILSGAAEKYGSTMEALLFAAARADHVDTIIRPALKQGKIVLCDRFMDSSRVYQGTTGKIDESLMAALESVAIDGVRPDLTLILDLDPKLGMSRADARRGKDVPDRFEKEDLAIHKARRAGFLAIAKKEPERCAVIDASGNASQVEQAIWKAVESRLLADQKALPNV